MTTKEEILSDLTSISAERRLRAIDSIGALTHELAIAVADLLERGPERFLIAERLPKLGPMIIPALRNLLDKQCSSEAKTLAALVLLSLQDQTGVPVLLEAIEQSELYGGLCASHLAEASLREAAPAVLARLKRVTMEEIDLAVSLILALKKLKVEIPSDLAETFKGQDIPWQIRSLLLE